MINPTQDPNNLQRFYVQKKQRIDLYIDMSTQNVLGFTKLIFKPKSEIKEITRFINIEIICTRPSQTFNTNYRIIAFIIFSIVKIWQ